MERLNDEQRELVEKSIGLARKLSYIWHRKTGIDKDDCLSIAHIGLCKAAIKWDEERSAFSTYVYTCIDHEFGQYIRRGTRQKRTAEVISMDKSLAYDNEQTLNDIIGNPDNYMVENPLYIALKQVSPEEQNLIYDRYFLEKTQSEIGKIIGVTQVQVGRKEKAVKSKLKLILAGGLSVG